MSLTSSSSFDDPNNFRFHIISYSLTIRRRKEKESVNESKGNVKDKHIKLIY
jgi:hypothetical protein